MSEFMALSRKQPRDFVYVDELWQADTAWRSYFLDDKVWVFVDSYQAELTGDEDYSRIIIHAGDESGWIYRRRLADRAQVETILGAIGVPVSEQQLQELGFVRWQESYLFVD